MGNKEKISWVLSYVQGGVAEVWKDNILDEIEKGTSEVETMEELFEKIRKEFGEFDEESRKADELRLLVQGPRTCNEYVQEFKRAVRGSGYEGRALIVVSVNSSDQNKANCLLYQQLTKRTRWEFSLYCALLIYKDNLFTDICPCA